jgi:hypothetical protein
MHEQEVEVAFCDLCGTSVPVGDLDGGRAVRHHSKIVGACCLATLRGGSAAAAPKADAGRPAAGEGRLLPVAIVLLAAIAAATIFLDSKVAGLTDKWQTAQDEAVEQRRANSDVLMGIDVALERVAQRGDVEAATAKIGELLAALDAVRGRSEARFDGLRDELVALQRDVRAGTAQVVDYRPLFEDLRERHARLLGAIEAVRTLAAAPAAAPVEPPAAVGAAAPANDLPPDLAEQVRRLGDADPAVRFEAVDILVQSRNAAVLPHLLPLARDADGFVRRLTVEGLRDFPKAQSVDVLLEALADEDENVRDTAWRSLRDVTGQKLAFEAAASKEARARAVQRWREWWDKAKADFGK